MQDGIDIAGVEIGHATDLELGSGVTAVLFRPAAVASVVVSGGAPATRNTEPLDPARMAVPGVDAIVLSGGSVYGLDAAGGVEAALRAQGRGSVFAGVAVPIVSQAILFDLADGGNKDWGQFSPYRDLGWQAARAAGTRFGLGTVGAGTGAMTATAKGGLGFAQARTATGHRVAALVAVNALGAATIGDGPHFWAAPFEVAGEFGGLGWPSAITPADLSPRIKASPAPATTIGVVITDAALTRAAAHRLALMAHDGLARAILPAHAPMDGDAIFAAGTGTGPTVEAATLTALGHAATLTMARAIARGVFAATSLPYPGSRAAWRDRWARPPTSDQGR